MSVRQRLWLKLCPHLYWSEIEDGVATLEAPSILRNENWELRLSRVHYRCLGCGRVQKDRPKQTVYYREPYDANA